MPFDLEAVYSAVEDDDEYAAIADHLAWAGNARSASFVELDADSQLTHFAASYFPQAMVDAFTNHFIAQDPWTALTNRHACNGKAIALDRLILPEQFRQTEFFNELHSPFGDDTARAMGSITQFKDGKLIIGLHRAEGDHAFTDEDLAKLDSLAVHAKRVVQMRRLLRREQTRGARLQELADQSDHGLVRVDKDLRILAISAEARRILDCRDGLAVHRSRIVSSPPVDAAMRLAVSAVIDRRSDAQTGLLCQRPSGLRPYRIVVVPAGVGSESGAILKIDDPVKTISPDTINALRNAYRLTAMETLLVLGLLEDQSIEEIAARRGVGRESIKTQLKSLFNKTGVNRQPDLLKLLATFPLGIDNG